MAKDEDGKSRYRPYTTPYAGMPQVIRPDGRYSSQQRFGLYRWHVPDPVRFERDLRVTIQALGWRSGGRYLPLQDDIASVAYWYQAEPHKPLAELPPDDWTRTLLRTVERWRGDGKLVIALDAARDQYVHLRSREVHVLEISGHERGVLGRDLLLELPEPHQRADPGQ